MKILTREGIREVPLNFLHPHPGTPLANQPVLSAEEGLRIIAIFRHMLPDATLRVCGGRGSVFGSRQDMMFAAGANALMTGDYLTTAMLIWRLASYYLTIVLGYIAVVAERVTLRRAET